MSPLLRRGAIASIVLHLLVLLVLVVGLPSSTPEPLPPETEVSLQFEGSSASSASSIGWTSSRRTIKKEPARPRRPQRKLISLRALRALRFLLVVC